jgi:hypothetical protein
LETDFPPTLTFEESRSSKSGSLSSGKEKKGRCLSVSNFLNNQDAGHFARNPGMLILPN